MAIFSTRFAVLACLCAVIPLQRSVEAAHIRAGHSMETHTPSTDSPQRMRDPSAFARLTTARGDNQNHEYQPQNHELPPLFRRYHDHDPTKAPTYPVENPHGNVHDKVPRSAFARSRYRGSSGRRSSVYISGEHGNTYLVTRAPSRQPGHGYAGRREHTSRHHRRQVDESNLALGRIDIMVAAQPSWSIQRLASLTVDPTPIDWMSGQTSTRAFPLSASSNNQTQFIMIPDDSDVAGSPDKHVMLATQVFDADGAEMVMYCATYDTDPGSASALVMAPCTGTMTSTLLSDWTTDTCTDDASATNSHQSQIFSYDPSSGKVEPISDLGGSSGDGRNHDTYTSCAGANVRRDTGNATMSSSMKPTSTSSGAMPTKSASIRAQNVTLVYVAGALEVPLMSPSPSVPAAPSSAPAGTGKMAVVTTTITTTVIATVTASGQSTQSNTPALAAVTTTTRSSLGPSSTSSMSTAATPAPSQADESLEVEIVGLSPSTSMVISSSTTSTTTVTSSAVTTTSTSRSSHSPGSTLNAEAVASLVVAQMPHRKRAIVKAGASVTPVP